MLRPKDCPIPGCNSKGLIKLSNHLANVHLFTSEERKPWLQEAKLRLHKYQRESTDNPFNDQPLTIMDVRFKCPTNILVYGCTSSGKTYWTERILQHVDKMFDQPIQKIVYCYDAFSSWKTKFQI